MKRGLRPIRAHYPATRPARGLAEELWKDRQPGEPNMTVFVKNAEGIAICSAPVT